MRFLNGDSRSGVYRCGGLVRFLIGVFTVSVASCLELEAEARAGRDLFASGTISGDEREQRGSFLELSWGGSEPFGSSTNSGHTFLEDGDEVVLRASAPGTAGGRITLGEVSGRILPAREPSAQEQ